LDKINSSPSVLGKSSRGADRKIRVSVIIVLIILTVQGWTGDFSNLFAVFPISVTASMNGLFQALFNAGALVAFHALEGLVLVAFSIVILALSFTISKSKNVRIFAILGFGSVISAAIGGTLFVLSSFQNNANSAQMGGSFIGAYAFYFLILYFTK
jgi:hypothetical protein